MRPEMVEQQVHGLFVAFVELTARRAHVVRGKELEHVRGWRRNLAAVIDAVTKRQPVGPAGVGVHRWRADNLATLTFDVDARIAGQRPRTRSAPTTGNTDAVRRGRSAP